MRKTLFSILCAGLLLACASGLMADTAETIPFLTTLLPANETPPTSDPGTANVIIWVHVVRDNTGAITSGSVDFDVSYKNLIPTTITGLHIHNAPVGVAGSIVIPTDVNNSTNAVLVDATGKGRILKQVQFPSAGPTPTVATIKDLLVNPQNYYVNVHTTERGGGLMRGQLTRADMVVLMGLMSPQNETPPVNSNASGVATVVVLRTRDSSGNPLQAEALFNVQYTGFPVNTIFTGFHIHGGLFGVAGGVILNTGIGGGPNSVAADPTGTGNINYPVPVTPADANFAAEVNAINGLFDNPNAYYINLHTTVNGGGEIRSQMRTTAGTVFQESMLASNETPPIAGLTATGTAALPIYVLRNPDGTVAAGTVIFDVNFRGFPAPTTFTGLHIHTGAIGVAGGVVINTGLGGGPNSVTSDSGNGNFYKIVTVADKTGIDTLSSIVQTPVNQYVNLHTTVNPGGAVRAQLAAAPAAKPVPGGVSATSSTVLIGAPGSILSVYGNNLATFTSDLSGFFQPQALPTSLDGVSVTIAGTKAPLYFSNPSQINFQVPFEVAAGQQALVVTTVGGTSDPINITIASVAPSIFILDGPTNLGAIVRNSDFSVVTSDNPAKVGDILVIYFSGVGQTTPASQTGSLQFNGTLSNTVPVTVTIGGQNAPVIYSIASPGFAGLYQAAITVPAGVSGTSQVVLKAGNASSNSVNLPLR